MLFYIDILFSDRQAPVVPLTPAKPGQPKRHAAGRAQTARPQRLSPRRASAERNESWPPVRTSGGWKWQVRKAGLKRFGIATFADLADQAGDLLRYLAEEHDT